MRESDTSKRSTTWNRGRWVGGLVALMMACSTLPAVAFDFSTGNDGLLKVPTDSACPTLESPPRPYEVWFNIEDMDQRGYEDADNQTPWETLKRLAQVVCGAKSGSTIQLGMFFFRALGTAIRPESDPEVVWDALDYVHKKRNVKIQIVSDGGSISSSFAKKQVIQRLSPVSTIKWCKYGCYDYGSSKVRPNSINHEKFLTISNTIWDDDGGTHPVVYSSSANISRGQVRTYWNEGTVLYDNKAVYNLFSDRFKGMVVCADTPTCSKKSAFPTSLQNTLYSSRSVWVDSIYRHDGGDGTGVTVSFAPQPQTARDYYSQQFDDVDCKVDNTIRVAMFRLSENRAPQLVDAVTRLQKRGCSTSIIISNGGGAPTITPATAKLLYNAKIPVKCSAVRLHTKTVIIGSDSNNYGRVLFGTANMSTSGLRYSDEHVITIDTRAADSAHLGDARRLYGEFLSGWYEMSNGATKCPTK